MNTFTTLLHYYKIYFFFHFNAACEIQRMRMIDEHRRRSEDLTQELLHRHEKELRKQRQQYNRYDVNDSSIMHRSTVNEVRGVVEDTRPVLLLRRLCDLMKADSDW